MKLFLDEDSSSATLAKLLRKAGHDVRSVLELGTTGEPDPEQFRYAIREHRVLLSRNRDDFKMLHELIRDAQGHHPGVLIECIDNDASRDLTPRGIVLAISKLEVSGLPIRDEYHILNHWR